MWKQYFLQALTEGEYLSPQEGLAFWESVDVDSSGVLTHAEINTPTTTSPYQNGQYTLSILLDATHCALELQRQAFSSSSLSLEHPHEHDGDGDGAHAVAVPASDFFLTAAVTSGLNRVRDFATGKREDMQVILHRAVRRYLARALDLLSDQLKEALKDEDMPQALQDGIDLSIEHLLPNIKVEIYRKTEAFFLPMPLIVSLKGTTWSGHAVFTTVQEMAPPSETERITKGPGSSRRRHPHPPAHMAYFQVSQFQTYLYSMMGRMTMMMVYVCVYTLGRFLDDAWCLTCTSIHFIPSLSL